MYDRIEHFKGTITKNICGVQKQCVVELYWLDLCVSTWSGYKRTSISHLEHRHHVHSRAQNELEERGWTSILWDYAEEEGKPPVHDVSRYETLRGTTRYHRYTYCTRDAKPPEWVGKNTYFHRLCRTLTTLAIIIPIMMISLRKNSLGNVFVG